MHQSSFEKVALFRDIYLRPQNMGAKIRILEVGSMSYLEQLKVSRLFDQPGFDYLGVDIEQGPNVDLVLSDRYNWNNLPDEHFDTVICCQVLEHAEYFWQTLSEIGRVLKPGGMILIIVPSKGPEHRFPVDCWRFYPDAAAPILKIIGAELIEVFLERDSWRSQNQNTWGDLTIVGQKRTPSRFHLKKGETTIETSWNQLNRLKVRSALLRQAWKVARRILGTPKRTIKKVLKGRK